MNWQLISGTYACPKCGAGNTIHEHKLYIYKCNSCTLKINRKSHPIRWMSLQYIIEDKNTYQLHIDVLKNQYTLLGATRNSRYKILSSGTYLPDGEKEVQNLLLFI